MIVETEAKDVTKSRLGILGEEVISLTRQAQKISLYYICEIGQRLTEAKSLAGHGSWGEWLKTEVNYSQSTAENFIKIYKEYGDNQINLFGTGNSETFEKLPYSKLLALTALTAEQREELAEKNDLSEISVRELKDMIAKLKAENEEDKREAREAKDALLSARKEADSAWQTAKKAEQAAEKAEIEIESLKEEINELAAAAEAAQAQTAVPGFEKEKAELCEKYEKKLEKLKKELEKKKAEAEAAAEEAEKTAEKIRTETEEAVRRELAASAEESERELRERCENAERKLANAANTDLSAIAVRFEDAQRILKEIRADLEKVKKSDGAVYDKLSAGIKDTLGKLLEVI